MLNRPNKELNFIEKRRQWKSGIDKPLSRRTLIMVLPALALCVFVMMSAPYLKLMVDKFMQSGDELNISLQLNLEDERKPVEKAGPPPSPEESMAQFYREQLEKEGFDWRAKPEIEGPNLDFATEREVAVRPLEVELPATMAELEARSASRPSE